MFTATVINFLLFLLNTGTQVAEFIVFIREALVIDIDYSLLESRNLLQNALWNPDTLSNWAKYLQIGRAHV